MCAKWLLFSPFLFVFLMLFAVFSIPTYTAQQTSAVGDHLALLAIKSMIKDDPDGFMTSWNHSATNFCQWQGVTCNNTLRQRVTHLDLSKGGLNGTLSPSLGNLSFLRVIDLTGNSFSGEIPPEIGSLFRLRELRLPFNSFTGNIPTAIRNFTDLQVLDLFYNQLSGKIPDWIGSLSKLMTLDVSHNILEGGRIPSFIANLTLLNHLSFDECHLGGTILDVFQRLTHLRFLSLQNNNLTGTIPSSLHNCSSLEELYLDDNQLNGTLRELFLNMRPTLDVLTLESNNFWGELPSPANGSSLKDLQLSNNFLVGSLHNFVCSNNANVIVNLNLGNNHFSGDIPVSECWENSSNVWFVNLGNNNLSGAFPKSLASKLSLYDLDLSRNMLRGDLTKLFTILSPNLKNLDISENQFKGTLNLWIMPETFERAKLNSNEFGGSLHEVLCANAKKEMQILDLGDNHFSGVIPQCWEKWPGLIFLNLQNNNFSGDIPSTLGFMSYLRLLNMRGNKMSGRLPSSLMNLSDLEILQLGGNKLVGNIPPWIGTKLTLLRILNLRSNHFYGNIPHELCYLSHTQILDVSHNNLSGNIPRCFNNFSVMSNIIANLDAQIAIYNGFSTSVIAASDSLVMKGREENYKVILGLVMLLDLSSNNFSGQIPSELTALRGLRSLNLSRNQLTGNIPDNIEEMKSLESFDLSFNKLSGKIPVSLSKLTSLSNFNVSYNNLIGRIPTSSQIQSFNESSFFGNKLCGAPLTNRCVEAKAPPYIVRDQKEDDGSDGVDWGLIICVVLGFVTGFWIIVVPLIVNTSWRLAFFRLANRLSK